VLARQRASAQNAAAMYLWNVKTKRKTNRKRSARLKAKLAQKNHRRRARLTRP